MDLRERLLGRAGLAGWHLSRPQTHLHRECQLPVGPEHTHPGGAGGSHHAAPGAEGIGRVSMSGQVQKRNAQLVELLKSEFVSSNNPSFTSLHLPHTEDAVTGIIWKNGHHWMHDFRDPVAWGGGLQGHNIFLGEDAGNFTMGAPGTFAAINASWNTGLGYHVLDSLVLGYDNTAIGANALATATDGSRHTAVGKSALLALTVGSSNVAVGYEAMLSCVDGSSNVAVGREALHDNTDGDFNIAIGREAMSVGNTGSTNVGIGYTALTNCTGVSNVAIGYIAMDDNIGGSWNAAVGAISLRHNTTGSYNAVLGYGAGEHHADGITALTDPEYSVYIGHAARGFDNTDNNSIVIGASAIGLGPNTVVLGNASIIFTSLRATTYVDQPAAAGAIPVLALDQADDSEGFVNYIGNTAASAVGPISTWTAGNTIQGFVRVEINGAQFWMPFYDAPTA